MNDAGLSAMREYMIGNGLVSNPPDHRATRAADPLAIPAELMAGLTHPVVKVTVETAMALCDDGQYHGFDAVTVTV